MYNTLQPNSHNDHFVFALQIIDEYLKYIWKTSPNREKSLVCSALTNQLAKIGQFVIEEPVDPIETVLVPMNLNGDHWTLLVNFAKHFFGSYICIRFESVHAGFWPSSHACILVYHSRNQARLCCVCEGQVRCLLVFPTIWYLQGNLRSANAYR